MKKIKLIRAFAILLACSLITPSYSQITPPDSLSMTLDECLEFAKLNSITLQKAQINIEDSQSDQLSAKGAFLPSLSGSIGQDLSYNPLRQSETVSDAIYMGSYGVDLAMNIYNGGRNKAYLEKSDIYNNIASLDFDEYSNSIEVSVTQVYIEILYAIEQIEVAKSSLALSVKNEERGAAFLDVGSINSVDFAQLQSATASYEYDLIVAQTTLSNLYVQLKHLLEISQELSLTVIAPELTEDLSAAIIPTVSEVYDSALGWRPEILSSELYVSTAELDSQIAKAGYLPTVSLTAGLGISHTSSSSFTFSDQLRDNFSTSAGVRVSVPIFSQYENRTAVAKANNSVSTAELNLTDAKKTLYQTIETLHNNAMTAQAKYSVSDFQLEATRKSMELTTLQYEVGIKNTIELLTEQDNYTQSYQDYLINKYQFIYNKAILNYYKTNIIKL